MLDYFPFTSDRYAMAMGVQPLGARPLIELEPAQYRAELTQKLALLAQDAHYYSQTLPLSLPAQWEALGLVLRDLVRHHPQQFALQTEGARWRWHNRLAGETTAFVYGDDQSLPAPLDWAGRQVQEDLLLLSDAAEAGFPLIAGQLCFANMWCLDEKIGQPFLAIHAPVPSFGPQLGRPSSLLLERLKPERPVWRLNWSIVANDWLNLTSRFAEANDSTKQHVSARNAGEQCFLRVERQGLVRLPASGAVLFTIHTYLSALAEECQDHERARRILGTLRSMPPEMLAYKGITPFLEPLCAWLERRIA
ncbi:MAG: DUF3445 domain-containing protein [Roseiflexaceae bacterium]|nr:DUF3445 domain-containing protein [Roseiflexaceae bacterium]